jgi:hypothetical protein
LEESLKNEFKNVLGADAHLFDEFVKANMSREVNKVIEKSKKIEVINKAQSVINNIQLEEITTIMDIIKKDLLPHSKKRFYIVLDDLDKEWVDNKILFDLIVALLQTIKELNTCLNLKIVVALRLNLYQLCLQKSNLRGTQREKFSNMILHLYWSKEELTELLQKRLNVLTNKHQANFVDIDEILPHGDRRGNKDSGMDYILNRTLFRPRDVISYFNKSIKYTHGKPKITREALRLAESEYSTERLQAIEDEWKENLPGIKYYIEFLINKPFRFQTQDISPNAIRNFCQKIYRVTQDKDVLDIVSYGWEVQKQKGVITYVLNTLYQMGIIGVKTSPNERIYYSFLVDNAFDSFPELDKYTFYINPTFYLVLHTKLNIH